jgi:hypothetical protein
VAIPLTRSRFRVPAPTDEIEQRNLTSGWRQALATAQSQSATWAFATVVGVGVLVFALLRYRVLASGGAPATVDAGNWLAFGNDLLGPTLRPGSVYPPLVPLVVLGAVQAFGLVAGVAAVGAVASIAPAIALVTLLYKEELGWWSAALAAVVLAAGATGEMTAWGGFPQLLATAFVILFLWRWDQALRQPTVRAGIASGVLLGLITASSHLIMLFAVFAALAILVGHLVLRIPHAGSPRRWMTVMATAILPSLAFLPIYLRLSSTVLTNVAGRTSFPSLPVWLDHLEFVYREAPILWRTLLVAGGLALLLLVSRRRETLWLMSTSMFLGALVLAIVAKESRFLFLVQPAAIIAIGLWVGDVRSFGRRAFLRTRRAAAVALVLAGAAQVFLSLAAFPQQRAYYGVLRPGTVSAINWLRDMTPRDAVVAVSRIGEPPLGWWAEGLGRRPTLYASSLTWLNFPDEKRRARLANDIFAPTFPSVDGLNNACQARVSYVLVAKGWGGFDGQQLVALEARHRGAVVVNNSDAVVLSMAALGCPQRGTKG